MIGKKENCTFFKKDLNVASGISGTGENVHVWICGVLGGVGSVRLCKFYSVFSLVSGNAGGWLEHYAWRSCDYSWFGGLDAQGI